MVRNITFCQFLSDVPISLRCSSLKVSNVLTGKFILPTTPTLGEEKCFSVLCDSSGLFKNYIDMKQITGESQI